MTTGINRAEKLSGISVSGILDFGLPVFSIWDSGIPVSGIAIPRYDH